MPKSDELPVAPDAMGRQWGRVGRVILKEDPSSGFSTIIIKDPGIQVVQAIWDPDAQKWEIDETEAKTCIKVNSNDPDEIAVLYALDDTTSYYQGIEEIATHLRYAINALRGLQVPGQEAAEAAAFLREWLVGMARLSGRSWPVA